MSIVFNFNRDLVLKSFAKTEEQKEANKADYYKRQTAGKQSYITRLKNQLTYNRNGKD